MAITILVKNPNAAHDGCRIRYRDIGDYLTRDQKLEELKEARSTSGFRDWQTISPNEHHDWIGQRGKVFAHFYPLGSKEAKAGSADDAIFKLYSQGVQTTRDAHIYNFARDACAENARRMAEEYLDALSAMEANPELTADEAARRYNKNISWAGNLKEHLQRKETTLFASDYIRKVMYRPFVATNGYMDDIFIHRKHQMDRIFPHSSSENRVICVIGKGSTKPFSAVITDTMLDRHFNEACQCFPRYRYPKPTEASNTPDGLPGIRLWMLNRIDNISDSALRAFRENYRDDTITKDALFDYVYGVLHAPSYGTEFANDLSKMLPRIPFAPDFMRSRRRGKRLGNFTSVTRGVNGIRLSSYSHMKGNRCRGTFD